ncbi:MAG: hypothetical protein ACI841_003040 [Planctomycetota bacterium]|jgi:uncharacterized protein (DUF2237 family)
MVDPPRIRRGRNVLGQPLKPCCTDPLTGFYRDGYCRTGRDDRGLHTVCTKVTAEFLEYSKRTGNDLSTPRPEFGFRGLRPGDCWCVCVERWVDAFRNGAACPIVLEATHFSVLEFVDMEDLQELAAE